MPRMTGPDGLGAILARQIAEGAHFRLLRVHRQGDQTRALFRIVHKGIDYNDFILVRGDDGTVRIGNVYRYDAGFLESEEYRLALGCLAARQGRAAANLPHEYSEYAVFEATIDQVHQHLADGKAKEALTILRGLPDTVNKHPNIRRLQLLVTCDLEPECDEAIKAYRAAFPDDIGINLALLQYCTRRNRVDDYIACVDRLDTSVGGDPYLGGNRSLAYVEKGDLPAARKSAEQPSRRNRTSRFPPLPSRSSRQQRSTGREE